MPELTVELAEGTLEELDERADAIHCGDRSAAAEALLAAWLARRGQDGPS